MSPNAQDPTEGAIRILRGLLCLVMAWWAIRLGSGASTRCFLDLVNLPFHEAGHLFFTPFGRTMHFLGGTLTQLLIPFGLVVYFILRRRQPFAAAFCLFWVGENLINIAVYMADARTLAIPLVGGGVHDWNWLFFRFGLLAEPSVNRISTVTHALGVATMIAGLAWAIYFVLPPLARKRVHLELTWRWPWIAPLVED